MSQVQGLLSKQDSHTRRRLARLLKARTVFPTDRLVGWHRFSCLGRKLRIQCNVALPSHTSPPNPPQTGGFKLVLPSLTPGNAAAKTPSLLVYPPLRREMLEAPARGPWLPEDQDPVGTFQRVSEEAGGAQPLRRGAGPGDGRLGAGRRSRLASTPGSHVGLPLRMPRRPRSSESRMGGGDRRGLWPGAGSQTARGPHTQRPLSASSRLLDDRRRRRGCRRLSALSSACQVPEEGEEGHRARPRPGPWVSSSAARGLGTEAGGMRVTRNCACGPRRGRGHGEVGAPAPRGLCAP